MVSYLTRYTIVAAISVVSMQSFAQELLLPAPPGKPSFKMSSSKASSDTCGYNSDISQDVALYDGSFGIPKRLVDEHEPSVVELRWQAQFPRDVIDAGGLADLRWCSGTLLPGDRLLTAGHCIEFQATGWVPPKDLVGNSLSPDAYTPLLNVEFNYQLDNQGVAEQIDTYPVIGLIESAWDNEVDYAILQLGANSNGDFPSKKYPIAKLSSTSPNLDTDIITNISHPATRPKQIESGFYWTGSASSNNLTALDLHATGGSSGSSMVDTDGHVISLANYIGCIDGYQYTAGTKISVLRGHSAVVRDILDSQYLEDKFQVTNDFSTGIKWANTGDFNWLIHSGNTPSSSTGPNTADGSYAYFETSVNFANRSGDSASIVSQPFPVARSSLSFKYSMYGIDIGTLTVEVLSGGSWQEVWRQSGQVHNSGNDWSVANISLAEFDGEIVKVRFNAIASGGWRGDIALDNISIKHLRSGSKLCEFNDPSSGTTSGCRQSTVGGGAGVEAFKVTKNNDFLLYVEKVTNNGNCSVAVSGYSANYRVSGTCNNYSVYIK